MSIQILVILCVRGGWTGVLHLLIVGGPKHTRSLSPPKSFTEMNVVLGHDSIRINWAGDNLGK